MKIPTDVRIWLLRIIADGKFVIMNVDIETELPIKVFCKEIIGKIKLKNRGLILDCNFKDKSNKRR